CITGPELAHSGRAKPSSPTITPGSSLAVVGCSKFMRHSPFPKSAALLLSHRYILPGSHRYAARDDTAPQLAGDWWHTPFLPRESPSGCRLRAQLLYMTGSVHR